MRHYKRTLVLLFIGIISLIALACLIYFLPPTMTFSSAPIFPNLPFSFEKFIQMPPLIIFFLLVAIFFFSIGTYIFKSKTHGLLIAGTVITYLLFRINHLTNPFFLILLLALFFTLEMLVSNSGNSKL